MFIWLIPALAPEESATQGTRDVLYRAMAYMSQNYKLPLGHPRHGAARWA